MIARVSIPFKPCSVENCQSNAHYKGGGRRGYCVAHLAKWKKYGDPTAGVTYLKDHANCCSVAGCERPYAAKGFCGAHYAMFFTYGRTEAVYFNADEMREWLLAHVAHRSDDCLIWPFTITESNGRAQVSRKIESSGQAQRAMCALAHGDPPSPDHETAHSCGNGHLGCVNPGHVRWATHAENMADMVEHGRSQRGERARHVKLKSAEVLEVRRALAGGESQSVIARRFRVSRGAISHIARGTTWAHLSEVAP